MLLAHEALARGAHQRDGLGEEDAHRVPEGDRLLVDAALRIDLRQCRGSQLDRGVQRQGRELLPLCALYVLRLLLRELAQTAHQVLGVTPERESKAAASATFHESRLAVPCTCA